MKQTSLFAAIALAILASPATAKPMWEIADQWRCDLQLHLIADLQTQSTQPTGQTGSFIIDFPKGTRGSPFVDTKGKIVDRQYLSSVYGGFNLLTIAWNGEIYPGIIIEDGGEWWQTAASGYANDGRKPWISGFQCQPMETS